MQNKAQYDLGRQIATIKRFEYSQLGSELKKRIDIVRKQYQGLYKVYEFHRTINKKITKQTWKYNRWNLIYKLKISLYEYHNIKYFHSLSLESKCPILASSYNDLNTFNRLKLQKERTKEKKDRMYDNASEICNEFLEIYFNE